MLLKNVFQAIPKQVFQEVAKYVFQAAPPCALIEFMGRSSAVVLSALCSRRTISALTAPCALQSVPQWFFAPQCFAKRAAVVLCSRCTIICISCSYFAKCDLLAIVHQLCCAPLQLGSMCNTFAGAQKAFTSLVGLDVQHLCWIRCAMPLLGPICTSFVHQLPCPVYHS